MMATIKADLRHLIVELRSLNRSCIIVAPPVMLRQKTGDNAKIVELARYMDEECKNDDHVKVVDVNPRIEGKAEMYDRDGHHLSETGLKVMREAIDAEKRKVPS